MNCSICFPNDPRAQQLSRQTFLLSEFLEKQARDFQLAQIAAKGVLHGHCHHKSLMKMTDEEAVLKKMGVDLIAPRPGLLRNGGVVRFRGKTNMKFPMAIGELELLPAVRNAASDSLIIADGFSCREQIAQGTDRQALHLAEVIAMALQEWCPSVTPEGSLSGKAAGGPQAG